MNATVENDIRELRVVGTTRPGTRATGATHEYPLRFGPDAPRTFRGSGELVALPHVVGVAHRALRSTAGARLGQAAQAA